MKINYQINKYIIFYFLFLIILFILTFIIKTNNVKQNLASKIIMAISKNQYFIDCDNGNDNNSGRTIKQAFRNANKINEINLVPGIEVYLKKGCTWNDQINIKSNGLLNDNIIIGSYGEGDNPTLTNNSSYIILISGSYIELKNLNIRLIPSNYELMCDNNPSGEYKPIILDNNSSHITIKNSNIQGGYSGIFIAEKSHHNTIISNHFNKNIIMSYGEGNDDDHGAFGVLIWGDDNIIKKNKFEGNDACSYDYKRDGSAIEIYGGKRNLIINNYAFNNDTFVELGNNRTSDNTIAYNLNFSSLPNSKFIVTRGSGNFGPVLNTKVFNNSTYLTGNLSQGIVCLECFRPNILTLRNNIIWSKWITARIEGNQIEDHNIFWGGRYFHVLDETSKFINPQFVNPGTDFKLLKTSPAIDSGINLNTYLTDLNDKDISKVEKIDIGAFEY